jgi:hypothetical protein
VQFRLETRVLPGGASALKPLQERAAPRMQIRVAIRTTVADAVALRDRQQVLEGMADHHAEAAGEDVVATLDHHDRRVHH